MKVAIGSDKSGFNLKEAVKAFLTANPQMYVQNGVAEFQTLDGKVFGIEKSEFEAQCKSSDTAKDCKECEIVDIEVVDLGTTDLNAVHPYHQVAGEIAPKVQSGEFDRGILVCGTGAGMSVVANKFKGVEAVACESVYSAKMARAINGAQILCMGGWIVAPEMGLEMAKVFLATDYLQGLEDWRKTWLTNAAAKVAELENKIYGE